MGTPFRILVVEDEPVIRELVRSMLSVRVAENITATNITATRRGSIVDRGRHFFDLPQKIRAALPRMGGRIARRGPRSWCWAAARIW